MQISTSRRRLCAVLAGAALLAVAVPASAVPIVIDLVHGDTGTANGTIYDSTAIQSTGTGVIDPFLRIQVDGKYDSGTGLNDPSHQQGYNTSIVTPSGPWDDKPGTWTHDLHLSDLVTVTSGSTSYYEFLLDINEDSGHIDELLSLNNVQVFTRSTAISSAPNSLAGLGTLRYDMDQVGGLGAFNDVTVELDYSRNHGSGSGDLLMYIPTSLFANAQSTDYVYFYSLFGTPNVADAGFEEWALKPCAPNCTRRVPEPDTFALLGLGLAGIGLIGRRRVVRAGNRWA